MSRFLTSEWLQDLEAAAGASDALAVAAEGMQLTVCHVVTGGEDGEVAYRVSFDGGRVRVEPGPGPADIEVRQSYETAVAVNQGKLTPSEAFASGRMRLGGTVGILAQYREPLARLGDVFAGLRATTTY